jgi:hypothetical protein
MTRDLLLPKSPRIRVKRFLRDFWAASNDTDIEITIGSVEGAPAVLVSFCGRDHGFSSSEARRIAQAMEDGMRKMPTHPDAATLPNIIMGLRAGADRAEQEGETACLRSH